MGQLMIVALYCGCLALVCESYRTRWTSLRAPEGCVAAMTLEYTGTKAATNSLDRIREAPDRGGGSPAAAATSTWRCAPSTGTRNRR